MDEFEHISRRKQGSYINQRDKPISCCSVTRSKLWNTIKCKGVKFFCTAMIEYQQGYVKSKSQNPKVEITLQQYTY
jgi:hypothetical protein